MRLSPILCAVSLLVLLPTRHLSAQPARVTVDAAHPGPAISPLLYGVFFEEINRAGDGGLYAELVQNRSFEDDLKEPAAWNPLTSAKAKGGITLDASKPLNARNPVSLRIDSQEGAPGEIGASNEGFHGIAIQKGASYRLSLHARSSYGFTGELKARLLDANGKTSAEAAITNLKPGWTRFETNLTSASTDPKASLCLSISRPGSVWIDQVSLMNAEIPPDHPFRPDLLKMLRDMKPSFVRFPGGCYVEGDSLRNAFRWKDTIGDPAQRPGHWNLWGYRSNDGLGYHEYLQLCEDLKAEPLYVINCGMAHQDHATPANLEEFVQDALDAVEYANGDVSTPHGAARAANGHPAPFNMKYLEIGNENGGPVYEECYARFHDALKKRYPDLTLVADTRVRSRPVEIVDEHYYNNPTFFLAQHEKYDDYDRLGPRIYVGEFAVTSECGNGNLQAALAEAAFMTGMERNGDIVVMSSYAPLFENPGWKRWNPNAILFDSARVYGTPSYHVQALFAANRADEVLPCAISSPPLEPKAPTGRIGVGTWSTQADFKDITFTTPDGKTAYSSDFSGGTQGWRLHSGSWEVAEGALRQTSNEEPACAFLENDACNQGTLRLKARKISGAEGFLISFQSTNPARKSWWNIGGWGNREHGIESPGLSEARSPGAIEPGRWYDIRLELDGPRVRCYLDDKLVHDASREPLKSLYAVAGRTKSGREILLKVVNPTSQSMSTSIELQGAEIGEGSALLTVLAGEKPDAENSFEKPAAIAPASKELRLSGPAFEHTFPAYSVTVIRVPNGSK